ncbi:hypothetical protein Acr_27g0000770 [Actinidia rufa]|uniref:Retrotransposon gag domain-containing protein n=1 Tax=Actinidia rufa TaxID=165716 RepID=A0A7J0H5P5_9ERIC|nr:hypothetical protein Acr_27g0000770 [Actinidia rufa]
MPNYWNCKQYKLGDRQTSLIKQFQDLGAKEFTRTLNPIEAENWLKDAVQILDRIGVTEDERVDLVKFMFKGEALHWWEVTERLLTMPIPRIEPPRLQLITWARFVKVFEEQYHPESYKFKKEQELLSYVKGKDTSVAEYERKFTELSSVKNTEEGSSTAMQGGGRGSGGRPMTFGRAFTLSMHDAQATPDVVTGMLQFVISMLEYL